MGIWIILVLVMEALIIRMTHTLIQDPSHGMGEEAENQAEGTEKAETNNFQVREINCTKS
ncbi:hypothetical protein B0G93_11280 [Bacillus sp. V-88]|nr:hypothetical protein B1B00_12985 [Bacillus sp. DSM 27956]PRX75760.1 hypothetical protein B0G93_11280 [Bacillus sp. V-88]SLK23409.1 hypothetical protein SAMN06295884_11280 [Bacillus sp. V-88]